MPNPDTTPRIIRQGRALVRAIEAITTIDSTGWFERMTAGLPRLRSNAKDTRRAC